MNYTGLNDTLNNYRIYIIFQVYTVCSTIKEINHTKYVSDHNRIQKEIRICKISNNFLGGNQKDTRRQATTGWSERQQS